MIFPIMTEPSSSTPKTLRNWRLNFKYIGGKMIKKLKECLTSYLRARAKRKGKNLKKLKPVCMIAWSYFPRLRSSHRIMNGFVRSVKIMWKPKNKCIFTKHLRSWSCAWRDSKEKITSKKNTTCTSRFMLSLIDFPVEGLDLSEYVLNHKLPNQW